MAPLGPLVRLLAQMVIPVVAVLARALPAAYAQALQNAKKAGVDGAPAAAASILRKTVSRSEALQILNLTEKQAVASPEVIQKVCSVIVWCMRVRYVAMRAMYVVDDAYIHACMHVLCDAEWKWQMRAMLCSLYHRS
jgi:hypothetical protein